MSTGIKKVLITGGSGFIGMNLVELLTGKGIVVVNLDKKPPVNETQKRFWNEGNVCDTKELSMLLEKFCPDQIIHLAARTDLRGNKPVDYEENVKGAKSIIDSVKKNGRVKRIIFASSMLVSSPGKTPSKIENCTPTTAYGASKLEMEKLITSAEINAEWLIIRPTSIWGPWFGEPYRNFFDIVLNGLFIHPGNKACTKTYGFVGNSVRQLEALMEAPANLVQGKCFYIGDYPPLNISQWADQIRMVSAKKKNFQFPYSLMIALAFIGDWLKTAGIKFPMTSFRLKNMTRNNVIDLQPIIELAGEPKFTTEEGIHLTLDWIAKTKLKMASNFILCL